MEKITKTVYVARNGMEFENPYECSLYEEEMKVIKDFESLDVKHLETPYGLEELGHLVKVTIRCPQDWYKVVEYCKYFMADEERGFKGNNQLLKQETPLHYPCQKILSLTENECKCVGLDTILRNISNL